MVLELWRWPVKGMAGERLPSVRVDRRGVGGDRVHAVLGRGGAPLTGADVPALEQWGAAYPFNLGATVDPAAPPHALVTSPDGHTYRWGDPRLRTALEDSLGMPVQLARRLEGMRDVPGSLLVADAWAAAGLRANVRLDVPLEGLRAGSEIALSGGLRLRLLEDATGGAAHARALVNARIAAGESVSISRP